MDNQRFDRRDFIKKSAYAVPLILSLKAMPAFAASGSGSHEQTPPANDQPQTSTSRNYPK
jgi:hypothetical protein